MLARVLAFFFLAACHGRPPTPPTAVIDLMPDAVCAGDDFGTRIAVSGARSATELSLVPAPPDPDAPPLTYEWRVDGAEHTILEGELDEPELALVFDGARPLHLTLTVTTFEGGTATTLRTIGVVEPIAPTCVDTCDEGSTCIEGLCIDDTPCARDDECDCFVCDAELARCVPELR